MIQTISTSSTTTSTILTLPQTYTEQSIMSLGLLRGLIFSSHSSTRGPTLRQMGDPTGATGDKPHRIPRIAKTLWTRDKDSAGLCRRCRAINFERIFNLADSKSPFVIWRARKPFRPLYSLDLGKLEANTSCALCLFFYSARSWPRNHEDYEDDEYLGRYNLVGYLLRNEPGSSWKEWSFHYAPSIVLVVLPAGFLAYLPSYVTYSRFRMELEPHWIVPQSRMAASSLEHAKPTLEGLPLSQPSINYLLIRTWCEHCDIHHNTCAGATKTKLRFESRGSGPAIRCIDCHSREIVQVTTSDRFFALSYIWGAQPAAAGGKVTTITSQEASTSNVRRLPTNIPNVIEDAMIVVTSLGERYLWADQYCIDQNDAEDKHAQIGNMAAIYEGAYATIVSFSARDSTSGLPGVREITRSPHPSIRLPNHSLSAIRPRVIHSSRLIASSLWMKRGWTFQEAILSRRLLVFTNYQVEFICPEWAWQECTTMDYSDRSGQSPPHKLKTITPMKRSDSGGLIQVAYNELAACITEYSGRNLSYQTDALNAISGFLSRLTIYTYLGIPISDRAPPLMDTLPNCCTDDGLIIFLVFLMWGPYPYHPPKGLPRRDGFPSWSWLGWEGKVSFPDLLADRMELTRCRVQVRVEVLHQTTNGQSSQLVPLMHLLQEENRLLNGVLGKGTSSVLPSLTNYLWLEGPVVRSTMTRPDGMEWEHDISFDAKFIDPTVNFWYRATAEFRDLPSYINSPGTMYQGVITKEWECLFLFVGNGSDLLETAEAQLLILDQVQQAGERGNEDSHYIVVGTMGMHFGREALKEEGNFWQNSSLQRRIKLG